MEKMVILGGAKLEGSVEISGAKNSAVAILVAAIMVKGKCHIENVPHVSDVEVLIDIINCLGGDAVLTDDGVAMLDCTNVNTFEATYEQVARIRASSYLMGALLGRFGKARVALPGGCDFGIRPIDLHLKGFQALGATYDVEHGMVELTASHLTGNNIYLDTVSVGATINIMLAASLSEGLTVIDNAAKEPHIVDVANFLNCMGADIKGAGTDVIKIRGVKELHGGSFSVIPVQIEAGTFMVAAAATRGNVLVTNIIPEHMEALSAKLEEIGIGIEKYDEAIRVFVEEDTFKATNIRTQPHPGFPTDLQPQILTLLSIASGVSVVTENVWDNRFKYVGELNRMGANVSVDGKVATVEGCPYLTGAPVCATDLRAGAALVIAGLVARGVTEIYNLKYIDRGNENFEQKLRNLGAQITRRAATGSESVAYSIG